MRINTMLMLIIILTSLLSSCASHILPENGPTMEQTYDGMRVSDRRSNLAANEIPISLKKEDGFRNLAANDLPINTLDHQFHKLRNPELKVYVYPHLAGKDEVPIPGYFTAFNVYTQDHYGLPSEVLRG